MMYYIYEIKNLINGKTYIGRSCHSSKKRDRNYYGSGILIKKAIKKYGKNNFQKTILYDNIETKEEIILLEEKTIKEYKDNNKAEYNLNLKGIGNDSSILTFKGLKHTEEWKKEASERAKLRERKPHTEEWKQNNSKIMKDHGNFVTNNPSHNHPKWFTNGEKDTFVPEDRCPEGYYPGRTYAKKHSIFVTNNPSKKKKNK